MLSRAEKSRFRSLKQKKERDLSGLFLVEGIKPVKEALAADFPLERILISERVSQQEHRAIAEAADLQNIAIGEATQFEIEQICSLKNPEGALAIAKIPPLQSSEQPIIFPALYLWQVNDPGNLGTIMRTALWFGIKTILVSPESADIFSPKVVRSSMGAIFRLSLSMEIGIPDLQKFLIRDAGTLIAADMTGTAKKPQIGYERLMLAFGSESHGLPSELLTQATEVWRIDKYGYGESLNLAVAVGIILNEIRKT